MMTQEKMEKDILRHLYFQMLRIRLIEERIAELYAEQEMRCPMHFSIGQEAVAAGVCAALGGEDYVMSNHRSHAHYLAKGGDLKGMVAEFYGKAEGCCGGRGGSMHLIDRSAGFLGAVPIVASTIPIATGAAFGILMRGEERVVAVFFGDAATEEGVFHESLNFASLKNLPILFVCENNLYSVYSHLRERQPLDREIFHIAAAHGIESRKGNGNDVVEVYRSTRKAVEKARSGSGPSFLEFETYRWREHCGPNFDNFLGYRTEDEFEQWKKWCPIQTFEERFFPSGEFSSDLRISSEEEIEKEMERVISAAQRGAYPESCTLLDDIYAD